MNFMAWVPIIALVLAIIAVVAVFMGRREEPTPVNIGSALDKIRPLASELETVAMTIVQANEQRKREGKLTNSEAYESALNYVRGWFPVSVGITNDQIIAAINSAILIASAATAQIEASKATTRGARRVYEGPPPSQIAGGRPAGE